MLQRAAAKIAVVHTMIIGSAAGPALAADAPEASANTRRRSGGPLATQASSERGGKHEVRV